MNEHAARAVVLVRAIETADAARALWGDADRLWAGRVAAETVGERGSDDAFLAQRARLVVERIGSRHPRIKALAGGASAKPWLAPVVVAIAFVVGALGVDIGPAHRINLLAPPVLALLTWNVVVYVALLVSALASATKREGAPGPLRRNVIAWLRDIARPVRNIALPAPLNDATARFVTDWSAIAMPLWQRRAARLLHLAAVALAVGAIAGLYVRGIALEFRAAWQSTFLDAQDVASLLGVVLAPGSWLTRIPIPDASRLQAIGGGSAGENAAPWIHLYAATIVLIVIVPRLALAAIAHIGERRLARTFPLPIEQPYFRRLLHAWHQGTARVAALPYSFDVPKASAEGLARVLTRVFQAQVDVDWKPVTAYGADDVPEFPSATLSAVIVLFSLNATAERENHVAFAAAVVAAAAGRAPCVVIVDTSEFARRFAGNAPRIAARENAWRTLLADAGIEPVFLKLDASDVTDAAGSVATRLESVAA
jgi:ABC-type Co2+ transport system permease subunit